MFWAFTHVLQWGLLHNFWQLAAPISLKLSDWVKLLAPRLCPWPSWRAYTKSPSVITVPKAFDQHLTPPPPLPPPLTFLWQYQYTVMSVGHWVQLNRRISLLTRILNTWKWMILLYFMQTTLPLLHQKHTITRSVCLIWTVQLTQLTEAAKDSLNRILSFVTNFL